jgi:uncharacterized FAD-dependent dehydrogenase
VFDAIVIGAGPAGLSAAAELAGGSCLLVEAGPEARARDRASPIDLLAGVGGAGLFSDGKHSFFPSASALWQLPRAADAFEATARWLRGYGVEAGAFPSEPAPLVAPGGWRAKSYPSIYVPLEARFRMIDELWRSEHLAGARVVDAARDASEIVITLDENGRRREKRARRLIVGAGRWSPRGIRGWLEKLGVRFAFRRMEWGVRLEAPADDPLFARLPGVDGKLLLVEATHELRTFCTCRQGEVVLGEAYGLRAFSGRADGPPSGRSNFGLVVRSLDPALSDETAAALAASTPRTLALPECDARSLESIFGARGAAAVAAALARFFAEYPPRDPRAVTVHAPAIEGVGHYPVDDGALQLAPGVFVCGDAGGRFRGIVAAMVSGRYAARRLMEA